MSLSDYEYLVDFILKNPKDRLGIIGGEPTLHPKFIDIIKIAEEKSKNKNKIVTIFTNGIELEQFLPYIHEDVTQILLNYNDPSSMTKIQYSKLQSTLDAINELGRFKNETVTIGCNIHLNCQNYDYLWEIVDKYNIKKIRCSVVSPGGIYKLWKTKKEEYYNLLKPIFLKVCMEANLHQCTLSMDCGHIPLCYFSEEEKEIINNNCIFNNCYDVCPSIIDFTTDLKVTACFGAYYPVEYSKFTNTQSISFYLTNNYNKKLAKLNNEGKCSTCSSHKEGKCQGGCLSFASPI